MILKALRSLVAGKEDAQATLVREKFTARMNMIESAESTNMVREAIAQGFVALMKKFGELARTTLPKHCHENYIGFLDPKALRREAENFFSQARTNSGATDSRRQLMGLTQELVGYYLLSRSWENETYQENTSRNPSAFLNSSPLIRAQIKRRLTEFLEKHQLVIPE